MSLDKLNPALLRTDGASDGDALVYRAANARFEFGAVATSGEDFYANDYATYSTLQSEYSANDYNTLLSAQSNDFITYTTLLGRLDIVQDNVAAAAGGGDALGTVTGADLDLSTGNFFEVTADDQTLTFSNPPDVHKFTIKVTGGGTIAGYDLNIASYDGVSFSVAAQENGPQALFFKPDGTKMYVAGYTGDDVNEYNLSPAWDITSAAFVHSFSVVAQETALSGLSFKSDGTKMYIAGQGFGNVNEYDLGAAWDVSTASFLQSFSVAAQDAAPFGLFFKPDGTAMYTTGVLGDEVNQYTLGTAWDVSTASFTRVFNTSVQVLDPSTVFFNPDGSKMFAAGQTYDEVAMYNLSTPWNISTSVFSVKFSIAAQEGGVRAVAFKPDGGKMYIMGPVSDAVHQYTTGVATTGAVAFPASVTFESGLPHGAPAIGEVSTVELYTVNGGTNYYDTFNDTNIDILSSSLNTVSGNLNALETTVSTLGGDALGSIANNTLDLSTGNFFEVTADDQTLTFSNAPVAHGFTIKVTGAGYVSGYDLANASYDGVSFSVAGQETGSGGIAFRPDGLKMFIVGFISDSVHQYTLTTAFDLSTASYDSVSFSVGALDTAPTIILFNADGTKMFSGGASSDRIYQYTLTTAYDVSTASYDNASFSFASQDDLPRGAAFSNDGTKMFMAGHISGRVFQYTLASPFAISTASYGGVNLNVSAQDSLVSAIDFNTDGTKMFIVGSSSDSVHQYTLTTAFDLSTASYDSVSFSVAGQEATPRATVFSTNATKMFVVGSTTNAVYQYTTGVLTISTITYPASVTFSGATPPAVPAIGEVSTVELYTVDSGVNYYDYATGH